MRQPAGGARGLSGLAQDPAAGGGEAVQACAWCKRTTVGDRVPLKRCGWCRMFFYCSVPCQVSPPTIDPPGGTQHSKSETDPGTVASSGRTGQHIGSDAHHAQRQLRTATPTT